MERITEIFVLLDNKPSTLGNLCTYLAEEEINIESIGVFHDTAKIFVKNLNKAVKALSKREEYSNHELRDVLLVDLENKPGALAELTSKLGDEGINIEYCYGTLSRKGDKVSVVLDVSNIDRAEQLLKS
ncbi:MAG: ACT domain-containing protein [Candidatus Aminicenantes bacterium]|nr:ACT domain-containing protein [Candidatus Aminicenantes bacterium]